MFTYIVYGILYKFNIVWFSQENNNIQSIPHYTHVGVVYGVECHVNALYKKRYTGEAMDYSKSTCIT